LKYLYKEVNVKEGKSHKKGKLSKRDSQTGTEKGGKKWSFLIPSAPIPDSKIVNTFTADVVILGGGNAGHLAALAAAEAGASVAVVEKRTENQTRLGMNDFGCINSKFALLKGCPEVDVADFINEFQRQAATRANPELVRKYAERSGETLDWIMEGVSDDIKEGCRIFMHPFGSGYNGELLGYRTFRGTCEWVNKFERVNGKWNNTRRLWMYAVMQNIERAKALGAVWHYGMRAEQLIKVGKAVKGAIASDAKGNYTKFMANKGVLLACGDFSRNIEMCEAYLPEVVALWDSGWGKRAGNDQDGRGILMGIWAGGRMEPGPRACMGLGIMHKGKNILGQPRFVGMGPPEPFSGVPFPVFNARGNRFFNEALNGARGVTAQAARQPRGLMCQIWDARWREYLEYQTGDHGSVDVSDKNQMLYREEEMDALEVGNPKGGGITVGREPLLGPEAGSEKATVYASNSLEELADFLGYKGEAKKTLLEQIARYNALCEAGHDDDFGKPASLMWSISNPPYYGSVKETKAGDAIAPVTTLSGLVTDGNQQVLDINDEPIEGLFASGNCCGGRFHIQYATPVAGCALGMACTLGRIAGEYIASL
jgi:fumarate reductase flavoprotein subunit